MPWLFRVNHVRIHLFPDKQQEVDIPTPSTETPPAETLPPPQTTPTATPKAAGEKVPLARKSSDEGAQRRNRVNVSDVS